MAFAECGNGHIYDSEQFTVCPYCNGGGNRIVFGSGVNAGVVGDATGASAAQQNSSESSIGVTVAPSNYQNNFGSNAGVQKTDEDDVGKTVGVYQKSMNMEPVVGWFVCIEGPDKGKDYRILAKNNSIGRSDKMDICIKGDATISRENHARIAYDNKHNAFHLIPGESINNIYINDEPVYIPTKIEANAVVELGESKLMFVPFCSDKFTWKSEEKE